MFRRILSSYDMNKQFDLKSYGYVIYCLEIVCRNLLHFFVIPFYLQSVLVRSANCVKGVYSDM
jgi:hypothetical protein